MRPDEAAGGGADALELVFGPEGHLDEGAAHAFVDGALSDDGAARVVLHLGACERCAALVADARGLAAAAAGVVRRLDDGPGAAAVLGAAPAAAPRARPRSIGARLGMPRAGVRAAAAALVVVAVGGGAYATARRAPAAARAPEGETASFPADTARAFPAPSSPTPAAAVRPSAAPGGVVAGPTPQLAAARPRALASAFVPGQADVRRRRTAVAALPPAAAGVVAGEVRDAAGRPLAGTTVVVRGSPNTAVTDTAGRFVLRDVSPGPATVRAQRLGFATGEATVAVAPADTVRAEFRLGVNALALSEATVPARDSTAPLASRGSAQSMIRSRRTGATPSGEAGLGCFAVDGGRVPSPVRLGAGGVATAGRAGVRGAWAFAGDSLRVRWDDPALPPLVLGRSGAGWSDGAFRLVPTAGAGCGGL